MYDFLKKIPLFAELPRADLRRLCVMVEEVRLPAGEVLFAEGSQGDRAYIIREGQLEILKASGGREVLIAVRKAGEVIGEMALLQEAPRMASVRARHDSVMLALHKDQFENLLRSSATALEAMFRTVLNRWRTTEAMLRQSERMAQLGTLTAGVAHELNNPSAAVKRGTAQLTPALKRYLRSCNHLGQSGLDPSQWQALQGEIQQAIEHAARPPDLDALARGDREGELETWLEEHGVPDAWEHAPILVSLEYDPDRLETLGAHFGREQLAAVFEHLNATYTAHALLAEIGNGAGRISDIVKALKTYSYLDQAPVQAVDIHQGLEDTLLILRSKIKDGISLRREYAEDLPRIQGYGSELNQVWTNLLDNALDALNGKGEIVLRTRREGDWIVVEVQDDGPGIPEDMQRRIFDPFFTTKPPGKGTGLGLDISYSVVVNKHRGDIKVSSLPGKTCFQVWLPLNFETM